MRPGERTSGTEELWTVCVEPAYSTPAPAQAPVAKQSCTTAWPAALAAAFPAPPPRPPAPACPWAELFPRQVHQVPWQPESTNLREPCLEWQKKVSLTCLEIFRPGMEAARKIFTLFVLRPQRSGSRESSEKHKRLLSRHQLKGLVGDKRATHVTSLSWTRMGQTGISTSVPSVCGTFSSNPGIGSLGFQFARNQNAFFW